MKAVHLCNSGSGASFPAMSTILIPSRCGPTSPGRPSISPVRTQHLPGTGRRMAEFQQLEKGKIIRLAAPGCWPLVEVESGLVWITETPSQGDILLRAGSKHTLRGHGPVVLQALESAVIRLRTLQPLS